MSQRRSWKVAKGAGAVTPGAMPSTESMPSAHSTATSTTGPPMATASSHGWDQRVDSPARARGEGTSRPAPTTTPAR